MVIMDTLSKRLALNDMMCRSDCDEAVLEIDEAIACLDNGDQIKVQDEISNQKAKESHRDEFREQYRVKRIDVRTRLAEPFLVVPDKRRLPCDIPHSELKRYAPVGCGVWRSLQEGRGGFCGHVPPFRRWTEKFSEHPDQQSCKIATLRKLWKQRCEIDATDPKVVCDVAGLFSA